MRRFHRQTIATFLVAALLAVVGGCVTAARTRSLSLDEWLTARQRLAEQELAERRRQAQTQELLMLYGMLQRQQPPMTQSTICNFDSYSNMVVCW